MRTGNAFIGSTLYYQNSGIGYPRNRLKQTLKPNTTYCVRFYVNIANTSPRGIDSFGAWFADASMDTITKCNRPLTFVTPQISNPIGNIICDTLNWVPISGTFIATGNEKYMVIGNFRADNAINTCTINGPFVQQEWTDVCIDDVSCIEMDVGAYAGPDRWITPGDSIYIGRESDFATDPYCIWYQLPNTGTAIDTSSGVWVKPATATTYVVRQELECNSVKWDTVVVYMDPVGIKNHGPGFDKLSLTNGEVRIWPVPASKELFVQMADESVNVLQSSEVFDSRGHLIKSLQVSGIAFPLRISLEEIPAGIYYLDLKWSDGERIGRTFVVEE